MRSKSPRQIVILGMHRSGTSLVASIVAHAGIPLGNKLLKASASNVDGHYEDEAMLALNEDVLVAAGFSWDKPPSYGQAVGLRERWEGRFRQYAEDREQHSPYWAVKDPRLCLTAPLLQPYLSDPCYVVCFRDAQEVADSLARRNNFSREAALDLKRHYDTCIEQFLQEQPAAARMDLDYAELIADPQSTISALYGFLGISDPRTLAVSASEKIRSRESIRETGIRHLRAERTAQLNKLRRNPLRALTPPFWRRLIKRHRRYQAARRATPAGQ